MRNGFELRQ